MTEVKSCNLCLYATHPRSTICAACYNYSSFVLAHTDAVKEKQEGGAHYVQMDVQPWDVVDTWPMEQQVGFHRGNALKYLMRLGSKDASEQEARKAAHYCEKLAEVLAKSA